MKQKKKSPNIQESFISEQNWLQTFIDKNALWFVALWALVPYLNCISNGYSLDDDFTIYKNKFVQKGIAGIPDILTHPYMNIEERVADYRPLAAITFAIEQTLFGSNPHISHVINLMLYAVLCVLCFLILKKILTPITHASLISLLAVLLYAWHPAHTEVVNSLKNREELLSVLLGFSSFYFALKFFELHSNSLKYGLISIGLIFLACTAKLSALPFAFIIPMWLYFKQPKDFTKTDNLVFNVVVFLLPILFMAAVASKSEFIILDLENPWDYVGFEQKMGLAMHSLWFYLQFLFVPFPFSFYYGYNVIPTESIFAPLPILSLMLHMGFFITAVVLFFKRNVMGFLLLCYFASLAMYANIIASYAGIVSERAMFLSSFWALSILSIVIAKYAIRKSKQSIALSKPFVMLMIVIFGIFAVFIFNRNKDWKDAKTLMLADIPHLENSSIANFLLANEFKREAESTTDLHIKNEAYQSAKHFYRQCLKTGSKYSVAIYRLGMIYQYGENKFDSAFATFKRAYSTNQNFPPLTFELARCYSMVGSFDTAKSLLLPLYENQQNDTNYLYFLARAYFKTGETEKGFATNEKLIKINGNSPFPYLNQGWFWELSGNQELALQNYLKAYSLGNRDPYILAYLQRAGVPI